MLACWKLRKDWIADFGPDFWCRKSCDSGSAQLWLYLVDQELARRGLQCRSLFLHLSGGIVRDSQRYHTCRLEAAERLNVMQPVKIISPAENE